MQRAAWILVVVYTGVVGLILYLLACRRPFPGGHDAYTRASWKQGVNSEMHCLAGDATGIVIAASIVPALGLANGWDVTIEYLAGFVCGLFIFQALTMVGMYQGNYLMAVRKTFFAETVSMNMVIGRDVPDHGGPNRRVAGVGIPDRTCVLVSDDLASIVGGLIAYPINWWLVKNHLKHGCMTLPGRDAPAPWLGHRSPEHEQHGTAAEIRGQPQYAGEVQEEHRMMMRELPFSVTTAWVLATFVFLLVAILVTDRLVPIRFN